MKRFLPLTLKAAFSLALLFLALGKVKLDLVAGRLANVAPAWLAAGVAVLILQALLLALRWRDVALECGVAIPTSRAFRFTLIAGLFNQTLPSTIGGDAARIWLLAGEGVGWAKATYSVAIDRAAGLVMLAVLELACLPWAFDRIQDPVARTALVLIGSACALGPLVLVALGARHRAQLDRWRIARHAAAAAAVAAELVRAPRAAGSVAVLSLASHLMTVAAAWLAARSVAAPIDFSLLLLLIPPVLLVATIPVSIAGWGIRESAAVTAFAYAGLAEGDGLLVSVLLGAEMFAVGILGGVVWIAGGRPFGSPARVD